MLTAAYMNGQEAYRSGKSLMSNPHNWANRMTPDHPHTDWNDGWLFAYNLDSPAGRLFKAMASKGVSMATCIAAQERL